MTIAINIIVLACAFIIGCAVQMQWQAYKKGKRALDGIERRKRRLQYAKEQIELFQDLLDEVEGMGFDDVEQHVRQIITNLKEGDDYATSDMLFADIMRLLVLAQRAELKGAARRN